MTLTPQQRGRIGGLTRAATADSTRDITAAANSANAKRYLDAVPASITDEAERERRAALLRRADMIRLSAKAAEARKRKKAR